MMSRSEKNLFSLFAGARALAPKVSGERAQLSLKQAGGERPDLKPYWKERAREIAAFKRSEPNSESKKEALERANYFLEREEETMRAFWRKRKR